ncbi:MAG: hypothetical protein NVS4B3_14610 [Gemmatimonadaceae bacterium]
MDSTYADVLRDSLAAAGWQAYVERAQIGTRRGYHVRIQPAADSGTTNLIASALRARGATAESVREVGRYAGVARAIIVRRGSAPHSTARWLLSPTRTVLLAVDDARGSNAAPMPDGFVFAADGGGPALHVEGVWDVAPSPDWTSVAYGVAYQYGRRTAAPLLAADWRAFALAVGLSEDTVRAESFAVSTSPPRQAIARVVVAHASAGAALLRAIDDVPGETPGPPALGRVPAGWRVRWSTHGDTLFAGSRPVSAADNAPSTLWRAFDPTGARPVSPWMVATPPDSAQWQTAATAQSELARTTGAPRPPFAGSIWTVDGGGPWLRARRSGTTGPWRIIGPGRLLAATRSGAIIAALAPVADGDSTAGRGDATRGHVVVYLLPQR